MNIFGLGRDHLQVWLVVPSQRICNFAAAHGSLSDMILRSLQQEALPYLGYQVRLAGYQVHSRVLFDAQTGRNIRLRGSWLGSPRLVAFVNAYFLLSRLHDFRQLLGRAQSHNFAACVVPGGDVSAFAIRQTIHTPDDDLLHGLLRALTQTIEMSLPRKQAKIETVHQLSPVGSGPYRSPAMADVSGATAPRRYDDPCYLNTVLQETSGGSLNSPLIGNDAGLLAKALVRHREASQVPWVYNELICETDFRTSTVVPHGLPPEVHLSVTGRCNIECRFCSYDHSLARTGTVTANMAKRMVFLDWVRTLRLHSGNGEATTNSHLAEIIRTVREHHPHLELNFSTNGILLNSRGLAAALVDHGVNWINVSLNAATRENWTAIHGADHFDQVRANLRALLRLKHEQRRLTPVVYASMVLTKRSATDLRLMPALCRDLGIDRLTAIPFSSLGYDRPDRYQATEAYQHIGKEYDNIYADAVRAAELHRVSIELPPPRLMTSAAFGLERRAFHDFAGLEDSAAGKLAKLLQAFGGFPEGERSPCPSLWRIASVTNTARYHKAGAETHYLYPCLGPLGALDFSAQLPFRPENPASLRELWLNPMLVRLREAQRRPGLCAVCDACRGTDSRDPNVISDFTDLLAAFQREHSL